MGEPIRSEVEEAFRHYVMTGFRRSLSIDPGSRVARRGLATLSERRATSGAAPSS